MHLAEKYKKLKTLIGGNREKTGYEETFGMPKEESFKVTTPNPTIRRILGELEFCLQLSKNQSGAYEKDIDAALDSLLTALEAEGVLTKSACLKGEALLMPLAKDAKEYALILAAHAHIDMNWMWSWHETVAATVATFQTMLKLMEEYPDFCYSQSQAAVYKIIEKYAPELKAPISQRIKEGRWEVTASAWVETDKNMPNTESLVNHIAYTKKYLKEVWDIDPDTLNIDFSPDTFGHSANLPELDALGGVKYYYHCRGLDGDNALYRWKSPSGKELLVYREQHWYNSGITPFPAITLPDIASRSGGLKTGLVVYGVGDHGGGPTRRDLERALEMMEWPVFPSLRFGTFGEFFALAETVREKLPIVDKELNCIMPGCYTTQSRIKLGNRHAEAALFDAQLWNTFATAEGALGYNEAQYESAWQSVLFTHFHDILTGSCVQDTREHAMGEFTHAMAVANTRAALSMQALAAQIDTSAFDCPQTPDNQSYGAGVGFGLEQFTSPPAPERGMGKNRLFHLFNSCVQPRQESTEITVWDWPGDLRQVSFTDKDGNALAFQLIDTELKTYWDHKYFRVLVFASVPAFGYTTVMLKEAALTEYPFYLQEKIRTHKPFENYVLENTKLRSEFSYLDGALLSLTDKATGKELMKAGESGSLRYIMTERKSSNAWNIGRYQHIDTAFDTISVKPFTGDLAQGFVMEQKFACSSVTTVVTLKKDASALELALTVDWNEESANEGNVPVLTYALPIAVADGYQYDVPGGAQKRDAMGMDVPALQYGAALFGNRALALVTDSKYGFRAHEDVLTCTLINATYHPDPYPERGIHKVQLSVALSESCPKALQETALMLNHRVQYQSGSTHGGTLPAQSSLLVADCGTAVVSGVMMLDGATVVRLYETCGKAATVTLTPSFTVTKACFCDVLGKPVSGTVPVKNGTASFTMQPYTAAMIRLS